MTFKEGSVDASVILIAASVVGVTTIIVAFLGCMWCRNKWKKLTRRHYQFPESSSQPPVTQAENLTEFTLFPPPTSSNQFGLPTGISPDEVVFEPLPEIRSRVVATTMENVRPARFTGSCEKISLQDWFDEYQVNFPRGQLHFLREVGPAWYGQAVEGEALGPQLKRKVVVKILRVDATSTELTQYLQETRVCRDLKHPNLLNLLNRCLEVHPFLLIMEHCDMDLKSYLIEQRKSSEVLLRDGILLRMACDIMAALQYMHEHGFIHMDIAAHSCLVTSDSVVKLGDYGTAVHLHKSDFYCLGDVAFPIRWCAPETLMCTESVIEAKDITREANIWSFGVVLWELLEFGKLPYVNMNDNEVIQRVLIDRSLRLEQPKTPCTHNDMIYKIMQLCWQPPSHRPSIQKISSLLRYLHDNRDVQSETFEARWNALQPSYNMHQVPACSQMRFESDFAGNDSFLLDNFARNDEFSASEDFAPGNQGKSVRTLDCNSFNSNDFSSSNYASGDKSPSSGSISLAELQADMSPSLLNLRGSVEDLIADDASSEGLMSGDGSSRARTRSEDSSELLNGRGEGSAQSEPGSPGQEDSAKLEHGTRSREDSIKLEPEAVNRRPIEDFESGTRNRGCDESELEAGMRVLEDLECGTPRRKSEDSVKSEADPVTLVKGCKDSELDERYEDSARLVPGTSNRWHEEAENGTRKDSEPGTLNKGHRDSVESQQGTLNRAYEYSESKALPGQYKASVKLEHGKGLEAGIRGSKYSESGILKDGESEPLSLETGETSDSIQFKISEAIRDLDTILAEETSSETSDCTHIELGASEGNNLELDDDAKPNGESGALNSEASGLQKNELSKSGAGSHVHVSMVDD